MSNGIRKFVRAVSLLVIVATFNTRRVYAAAINTEMALAPAEGTTVVRSQLRYVRATDDPSGMGREKDQIIWSNTVLYGIAGNFILGVNVPFLDVEMDSATGTMMDEKGVGDITLIAKYRFWQHDLKAYTDRISGIFGLELPSGDDALSSHSLDPILGMVFTHQSLNRSGRVWEIDADVLYMVSTEARDVDLGDTFRYDFAFGYQLWPGETSDRLLMGILELNGIYSEQDWMSGSSDSNSGGHKLYLSPGLAFVAKRFIIEAGAKIPVIQELNGNQLEEDFSLSLGVRFQF